MHLIRLQLVLEHGASWAAAIEGMRRSVAYARNFEWLDPPADLGELTVGDVLRAHGPEEHFEAVDRWARAVWAAWAPRHDIVRRWAARIWDRSG